MDGNNAVILLEDVGLDKALGAIVQGAFGSNGQRCTATSRVIVEEPVYDEFMEQLIKRIGQLKIGVEEGANLIYGGHQVTGGIYDQGYYVEPPVFTVVWV